MERNLELVDICMYLPYDMTWGYKDGDNYHLAKTQLKITRYGAESPIMGGYLPILRPMTELTKPMTHPDVNGGEEFVPIDLFIPTLGCIVEVNYINGRDLQMFVKTDSSTIMNIHYLSISDFKLLSKLHFDYNSLLEQGLAIDINTLK